MKHYYLFFLISISLTFGQLANAQTQYENQEIDAHIDVVSSILSVENNIILPSYLFTKNSKNIDFYLNKNLKIGKILGAKIVKLVNNDTLTSSYVNKYKLSITIDAFERQEKKGFL